MTPLLSRSSPRCSPAPQRQQEIPAPYQEVLTTLGKQGDFKDNVLKVNIPRNDLKVTVAGVATPTPFGFGGLGGHDQGRRRTRGAHG